MASVSQENTVATDEKIDLYTSSVDDGVERIELSDEPCSSNQLPEKACWLMSSPHLVRLPNLTCQQRYDIYCNEVKIAECKPSQVMDRVHCYVEENLMNKKWLALWKGPYGDGSRRTVDILVEVDDVHTEQAHVSLVDPVVCNEPSVPREVIDAQLEELGYMLDVVDLYPVTIIDDSSDEDDDEEEDEEKRIVKLDMKLKEEVQQKRIAQVVDNVRFFVEHIHRNWDDEDEGEYSFDAYLRARLRLYYDVISGVVPAPLVVRYNRTMAQYFVRHRELHEYQIRIQNEVEPTSSEAVECWRKYYEILKLSGLLQIWETLQLRAEGPCFPRVLRRTKGPREDQSTVTHIVASRLTTSMLRDLPDDTVMEQHSCPYTALKACHEGDLVLIYPGVYSGSGFHELTESITIQGKGERDEVVIEAIKNDDLFVNVCHSQITINNITFVQADNTKGILRVESGHAVINNCLFRCDGTGITVREGAKLTMSDSTICGANTSAVELMPGSSASLEGNVISHRVEDYENETSKEDHKGAIHLHVIEPPKIELKNNKITSEGGYGITIGRQESSGFKLSKYPDAGEGEGGDAAKNKNQKVSDTTRNFLSVEMTNNTIDESAY